MQHFPQPEAVFRYFSELSAIPHGSGHTEHIRQWLLDTAKQLSLDATSDEIGNVIIRKPASAGYENHPTVILQGHMDMVCAKLPECTKNMETEGLELVWTDEFLSADGTTLGGDDGIAIAYAFALLESDTLPHPPLTVVVTVDEETGMDGATALSPDALNGTYLINLDSEEEGIFTVGCAGGVRCHLQYPVARTAPVGDFLRITVSGLVGGHSGAEIHKPLLNANVVMRQLLCAVKAPFCLAAWEGGIRDNVIPTDATVTICCAAEQIAGIEQSIRSEEQLLRLSYPHETTFHIEIVKATDCAYDSVLTEESTRKLLHELHKLPNGVQAMNEKLRMPETSLNLGIFTLEGSFMCVDALLRSGVNAQKDALAQKLHQLVEAAGGKASDSGSYPAWEYVPDTALEQIAAEVFRTMFSKQPIIQTIHAGLECGILSDKAPQLQCLSIGPDIFDIHTPRERLSLASVERTWQFLLALLKAL